MKLKKFLKFLVGALGLLVLLVVLTVLFWLGPTVKLIAETIGPKALGTPLTINTLSINPRNGTIHLSDFAIANPETFGKSNAVSLASLDVSVDIASIFSQTVLVHQVTINSPHFIYEQSAASDNIQEFILNIQEFVGYDPSAPSPDPEEEEKKRRKAGETAQEQEQQGAKIVVVEALVINDVSFHLANTDDSQLDFGMGFEQLYVSMTNGIVQLDNFYVSNPDRLETPNLFSLDQLEVLLEPGTIYSSNFTVRAVNIRKPHAFVEYNPETDTLGEFLKIATALASKIPTNAPKTGAAIEIELAAEDPEPETPPKEVILGSITIDDVQFHVVNTGNPDLSIQLGLNQLAVVLQEGSINLDQLFLANPKQLKTPNLFSLDGISIDFDPDSLEAETLVLNDVQVRKPHAFLELNKEANTVSAFTDIANGFMERIPTYQLPPIPNSAPATETAQTKAQPQEAATGAPPIALHNLLVDDIQVLLLDSTSTNTATEEPHMIAGIGDISVKLVDGQLQVNDVTISNVKGFMATNIFHLAGIEIGIQPESLFSEQVIIDKVFIDSPIVNLEQTEDSGNVVTLQNQLMQFAPPSDDQAATEEVPAAEPAADAAPILIADQPVILHQLLVTNLAVNLKLPVSSTNETGGLIGDTVEMLNPMDKLSLKKLNPLNLGADDDEEDEIDPDAPIKLMAFSRLSLEPLKGLLYIDNLRIANPPHFSKRDLVDITEFRIDLDPDSIPSDTLLIEDILVARPRIRYERQIKMDNFKALQKEIEQATVRRNEALAGAEKKEDEEKADAAENEEKGQKVIIEHILITKGLVRAKLSALPAIPVPLPDIELNDIGKEEGGASATEASTEVFDTFYETMVGAVGDATGFAGDAVKGVGSFGLDALGNMASGVTNSVGKVKGSIKGEKEEHPEGEEKEHKGLLRKIF
ncbi:AsmA family protein [Pontiellaceae bacterium B12227]|nr:AsmA family protein [Pontiellaceae bacterium B12227]